MDAKLNGERVIVHTNHFMQSELSHLNLRPSTSQPLLENPTIQQIMNSLHGHLPLLLHGLVIVRRHEDPPTSNSRVEKLALDHEAEQPVTILEIVTVHELPHVGEVEIRGRRGELRRRVLKARRWGERGLHWGVKTAEMTGEGLGPAGDLISRRGWPHWGWNSRWRVERGRRFGWIDLKVNMEDFELRRKANK